MRGDNAGGLGLRRRIQVVVWWWWDGGAGDEDAIVDGRVVAGVANAGCTAVEVMEPEAGDGGAVGEGGEEGGRNRSKNGTHAPKAKRAWLGCPEWQRRDSARRTDSA
ncbi:MAG: hypothetical protein M1822_004855 [Bathelium mastoideum]|nr:MAG: hypothetical protein M1822_004855 [Bathelium mastoideum]